MNKLEVIYPNAINHTIQKIYEDMDRYVEIEEIVPTFEEYLHDRKQYLEQIWVNVWINLATNQVSKLEKKQFLSERDYEVEGIDKKTINSIFRAEMRKYKPFQTIKWLEDTFLQQAEKWLARCERARDSYLFREQEEQLTEAREALTNEIEAEIEDILNKNDRLMYLHIRNYIAHQLVSDFQHKPKFQKIDTFALEEKLIEDGSFHPESYKKVSEFFDELNGEIHKSLHGGRWYFQYETYYDVYEQLIFEFLLDWTSDFVLTQLSSNLFTQYKTLFDEKLNVRNVRNSIELFIHIHFDDYFKKIQQEYVGDLIKLSEIPFDATIHEEIYEKDLSLSAKREMEEQAELERRRQEEAKMLDDIFGREYTPSFGRNSKYVLHIGETNTGKTYHALEKMKMAESGLYLAPLRLLALEVFDKLNAEGTPCSLKTGEEEKPIPNAKHISSTVEMFHEKEFYDVIVIDEAQMITDKDRGFSWYKAISKANASEVHIIGSRSAKDIILKLLGDSDIVIYDYSRETPLEVEPKIFKMNHVKKGDALICFSRKRVLENAARLQRAGHSVSMIYGSMPPETRKKQVQSFINGETKIMIATDAIGMGLNLPIRRVVFLENEKFDGTKRRRLTSQEVKQIAGRAGRKGLYNIGKVAYTTDIKLMKELLEKEDIPVHTFAIAPTSGVFERFQKYYRDLGTFFELWDKFETPKGTKKASLTEERELYERVRGTEIEARLSLADLYGFLHLPFSTREPALISQWQQSMEAVIEGRELPEPRMRKRDLEELELTYKAIGLHLLFLYRLGRGTEAIYWERLRQEISEGVHESLKTEIRMLKKKCKRCGKNLSLDHSFPICDSCFKPRYHRNHEEW